jgi:hypothetical protein
MLEDDMATDLKALAREYVEEHPYDPYEVERLMARPTGKVTYWTEMTESLLHDKAYTVPVLSECGITILDDETGPVSGMFTRYIKVRDEEAPDELEGKTVDLTFQSYTEDHYEEGHPPLIKHRISSREARR